MGLKRRAAGRKQVLDLTEKQDSPRRSWQTKYQQICVEHNTKNGDSPEPDARVVSSSSKTVTGNPLSGLLANYRSDSDGEDEERDLDAKVSDFLKEIQTIAPSGSSIVVPGQPMTTPGVVENQAPAAVASAWQEIYDETTGYIYYWHTETNDVTWETPAEYLPQLTPANLGGEVDPSNMASVMLGVTSVAHQQPHQLPQQMAQWSMPGPQGQYPATSLQAPATGPRGAEPTVPYGPGPADRASSDSEEERIEMITSFGETSEDDSEEEVRPPVKKKKKSNQEHSSQKTRHPLVTDELIGPRLPTSADLQTSTAESEMDEESNLLSRQVDDVGPPGVESELRSEEPTGEDVEVDTDGPAGSEALSRGSEEAAARVSPITTPHGSDCGEVADADVVAILSRLRSQVRVLHDLGGELPDEVREPVETSLEEGAKQDRPPEVPDFEREMERMEEELKQLAEASARSPAAEGSPKTTSFALIAGYGDDSDQDEEAEESPAPEAPVVLKRTFESLPTVPVDSLFPIADHIVSRPEHESPAAGPGIDVDPGDDLAPPKASHSILFPSVCSTLEVPLPALRLPDSSTVTETDESPPVIVEPMIDSTLPTKVAKRKKRLDISTSAELVAASSATKLPPATFGEAGLPDGDRKGFGFGMAETDADSFLLSCMTEFESNQNAQKALLLKNVGPISFVKGDVLLGPSAAEEIEEDSLTTTIKAVKVSEVGSASEEEACEDVDDLAQLIAEKAAFLGEGREPTSSVQIMAIQIETLVRAWHAHALSREYLSKRLGETGDELRRLETATAPEGWACQWDRSHKRYYYCNITSGKTQWEYPTSSDEVEETETSSPPPERRQTPAAPAGEDIAGGEQAMEICTTPPPSPTLPPSPVSTPLPPPPPQSETPPPPPPPTISEVREPSPPPPPRISSFSPREPRRQQKGKNKNKRRRTPTTTAPKQKGSNSSKKRTPTPPLADVNPPLPPLPPPPSSPPPPPPAELPPLPPTSPRQQLAYGEPLPPGVDPGELPYMPRPVPPPSYQPLAPSSPPSVDVGPQQDPSAMHVMHQHAMQTTYVMASYQPTMVTSSIQAGAPVMDYGGVPYMMHTHMSVPAVIAKPPAKKHKAALHAALDSFYSDLATMGPTTEAMPDAVAPPVVVVPTPVETPAAGSMEHLAVEPDSPVTKPVDNATKKKKAKKVVGLGLKKRGVSSLVAKWQQVQQEVRRDFETLDQDEDNSFQ